MSDYYRDRRDYDSIVRRKLLVAFLKLPPEIQFVILSEIDKTESEHRKINSNRILAVLSLSKVSFN
jgi:hypothetical protein